MLGGKWKLRILYFLGLHRVLRYSELKKLLTPITHKMLSMQLKELEHAGIIILTNSVLSYYFGNISFPLKQKSPLIILQKISCILLDCIKRLFSGNEKHKTTKKSYLSFFHFFFTVLLIHYLAKLPTFAK
ncbi:MAG: helix-turn-helix transcriptional regulator [Lachnospiraceae bacterium]|nr:helix-turn-helix transcriptional regulator [Lachnospiraceae bacterium]